MKPRPRQPDLFDTADTFALALVTIPDPATDHADRLATQARAADLTRRTQDLPGLTRPVCVSTPDGQAVSHWDRESILASGHTPTGDRTARFYMSSRPCKAWREK